MNVLSAGAVEPGLRAALAQFERETGVRASVVFNTAPQIRARVASGETFDVVVVPPALMDAFAGEGRVSGERVLLGGVGQGFAVRAAAPAPDLSSAAAMQRALREAERVVFNRATGGQYIHGMLERIGLYGEIAHKIVRYDSAAQVMQHLARGAGREIGFGPITEIKLHAGGVRYLGPLPPEVQHRNTYVASAMRGAGGAADAGALLRFLATAPARAALAAGGVEP